jgi:MFS family permease
MADHRPAGLRVLYAATLAEFTAMGLFLAAIPLYVTRELDGSRAQAGLSVGVFALSAVLLRPVIGRGIDNRGRRPFLVGAMALLAVTSPLFALAGSVPAVIALRVAQGAVGAAFYTTAAAVTTDLAGPERRASAIARFSLFLYAGFALGPVIAETSISRIGFGAAWAAATILALTGLAAVWALPETGGTAMARRAELRAGGHRSRRLLHPAALAPGAVLAATGVGYAAVTAFSPLYARQIGLGSSGSLYVTFAVTIIVVRLASLASIDARSRAAVALPGLALATVGLGVMALVPGGTLPGPASAFVGVGAFCAGFALIFPALMAFTVDRVEDHERGETLGSFTAFMDIGTGTGGFLVGAIADGAGFGWAYGVPALLCGAGGLLFSALVLRDRSRSPERTGSASPAPATQNPGQNEG